ncbi:hypothetical protein [Algoriphagus jejuensis]|uniref:hypothetical protein n=1 Tax=Algoriphagus jejuensis TaxID=419934 RepID=UPI0031D64780
MKWEERGVLKSKEALPPGSPWWNNVNLWFIFLSEFGAAALAAGLIKELPPGPSKLWAEFIQNQNPKTWYRAHNSSIIEGYIKFSGLAEKENLPEQVFINQVLYRLLFAQFMVEGDFWFPRLGMFLANPQGISVRMITHLDGFYPKHYPMTDEEVEEVMGKCHHLQGRLVKFLDRTFILPKIIRIYTTTFGLNGQLLTPLFLIKNNPCYPRGIPRS